MEGLRNTIVQLLAPITGILYFIFDILSKLKCLVTNSLKDSDPLIEVEEFCDYLNSLPQSSPSSDGEDDGGNVRRSSYLQRCTYGQLMEALRKVPNYVVVYLHDGNDKLCQSFCSSTLCNSEVDNFFITSNCKLWACAKQSTEGNRVCQTLRARNFPFISLVGFKQLRPTILLKIPGCELGPAELVNKLKRVMNDNLINLEEARVERRERDTNNSLRHAQDEEYNTSLAADREKERIKREEEEKERERMEKKLAKQMTIEKLRADMRSKLHPEVDHSDEDVIKVLIRLPSGFRIERKFDKKQSLEQLFIFVLLHETCPEQFEMVTNFPRRLVPCDPRTSSSIPTFEEFGFGKTETLFVNET